ncbi:PilZ domain-containing protein [Erythrobacter sp. Alg231-14]|uniref:PilZ domain-containing protein n=1 Tax=Erythrobacter sp. Alg231-14 TaxID=1922225 RepID=UPI000D56116C
MTAYSVISRAERRPLSLMVKSRVKSRVTYVDMIDISQGGCKIKATRGFATVGDRVTMKVGGINAPLGTIVWIEDRFAGVAFEGQMHAAVLDHLCSANGADITPQQHQIYRV